LEYLQSKAKILKIGKLGDSAMDLIEKGKPSLKGVWPPSGYAIWG